MPSSSMTSSGARPGCEEANEACPGGCQSWVATTIGKRGIRALITGTTSSPPRTARAPAGAEVVLHVDDDAAPASPRLPLGVHDSLELLAGAEAHRARRAHLHRRAGAGVADLARRTLGGVEAAEARDRHALPGRRATRPSRRSSPRWRVPRAPWATRSRRRSARPAPSSPPCSILPLPTAGPRPAATPRRGEPSPLEDLPDRPDRVYAMPRAPPLRPAGAAGAR